MVSEAEDGERLRYQRAMLADFGLLTFRTDDLAELLTEACRRVAAGMGVKLVKVLEHFPERGELLVRYGVNWNPGVVGEVTIEDGTKSPAGYAVQTGLPTVSRDLENDDRFRTPEVLKQHGVRSMVNVIIVGKDRPFGVLEVDEPHARDFDDDDINFLQGYANLIAAAVERVAMQADLESRAQELEIIAREQGHRMTNVLSLVQAVAGQITTEGRSAADFKNTLSSTVQALSAAERISLERGNKPVEMHKLASAVLGPFTAMRPDAIRINGGTAKLPARGARMLGLALHELATNAAKYGALSVPEGHVALEWECLDEADRPRVRLFWRERGGPSVEPRRSHGFGTQLLEKLVALELNGEAEVLYDADGLGYRVEFPIHDERGD